MFSAHLKELKAARTTVARLELSIAAELDTELAALPSRFGFTSVDTFISAIRAADRNQRRRKRRALPSHRKADGAGEKAQFRK